MRRAGTSGRAAGTSGGRLAIPVGVTREAVCVAEAVYNIPMAEPLRAETLFASEVPSFQPPAAPSQGSLAADLGLAESKRLADVYFAEREKFVEVFEREIGMLEQIVRQYSMKGEAPSLDELADMSGNYDEQSRAILLPRIEQALADRKRAQAIRQPEAQAFLISVLDREIALTRRYLKAAWHAHQRLLELRDESIRDSALALSADSLSRAWDDDRD